MYIHFKLFDHTIFILDCKLLCKLVLAQVFNGSKKQFDQLNSLVVGFTYRVQFLQNKYEVGSAHSVIEVQTTYKPAWATTHEHLSLYLIRYRLIFQYCVQCIVPFVPQPPWFPCPLIFFDVGLWRICLPLPFVVLRRLIWIASMISIAFRLVLCRLVTPPCRLVTLCLLVPCLLMLTWLCTLAFHTSNKLYPIKAILA